MMLNEMRKKKNNNNNNNNKPKKNSVSRKPLQLNLWLIYLPLKEMTRKIEVLINSFSGYFEA